jgi:hypothetical protein
MNPSGFPLANSRARHARRASPGPTASRRGTTALATARAVRVSMISSVAMTVDAPQRASPAAQPHSVRPSALSVAARWTIYWGLALLLGGATTGILALGGRLPGRRWALAAAWALGAAGLVGLAAAEAASVRVPVVTLLDSPAGARLLRIGVLMVLVAAAVLWAILRPGSRAPLVAVGVTAAAAMLAHPWPGTPGHRRPPGG